MKGTNVMRRHKTKMHLLDNGHVVTTSSNYILWVKVKGLTTKWILGAYIGVQKYTIHYIFSVRMKNQKF